MSEQITISKDLLDLMVGVMADLPYTTVQPVFAQLAHELDADQPKIQVN